MIKFEKIRFKNFGSFGNTWTEIDLDKTKTTLICGNNGSGKSFAFLDSITFALFGKPFRKINIPQLANSINEKGCVVEIEFMRGSEKFMVRRGINPRLFEIYRNGDLLSQDAKSVDYQEILENQILKMNYKTFTQVVILGSSSFVPFMQLSAADRRNVIENILDINIFSTMNVVLKGKILSMKETIKELSTKIEIEKNKIEVQKSYIATLERKNCEDNNEKLVRIKDLTDKVNELTYSLLSRYVVSDENEFLKDIDYAENQISEKESKIKKFNSVINKITNQIEDKEKENLFFKENNKCRVCTQAISENFKKEKVLLNNVDISDFKQNADDVAKTIEGFETDISNIKAAIKSTRSQYAEYVQIKREIDAHQKEIKRIESTINKSSIRENIDQEIQKLIGMEASFKVLDDERTSHSEELMYHEFASELLRDGGVKAKIIKYYLPHMNKYINKYLSSMDFFVQFNLDEEFNEQIKSRYRDEFSYMNFSEGEKMRIDLALLLAWREVARLKNSINCNLLILDEVFDSSLDTGGTDELMKLLKVVSNKTNVYVISHKADQLVDKFSSVVSFEKKNNFSRVIYN